MRSLGALGFLGSMRSLGALGAFGKSGKSVTSKQKDILVVPKALGVLGNEKRSGEYGIVMQFDYVLTICVIRVLCFPCDAFDI